MSQRGPGKGEPREEVTGGAAPVTSHRLALSSKPTEEEDLPELTLGDPDEGSDRPLRASVEVTAEIKRTGPIRPPTATAHIGPDTVDDPIPAPALRRIVTGALLDSYLLHEQIGEGGMATIFRAEDTRTGRIVAIKALHSHQSHSLAGKRFQREFRAIHRFSHPNIVQVYDYSEGDGQPYIVMEFVAGNDLKHYLKTLQAMPPETRWPEVVRILGQVCLALDFIHRRGVIHRDLKPSNILLTTDRLVKLTDFGVAKPQDASVQLTQAGMLVGTLAYLAPEVFDQAEVDHRVDLYALGVLLYVMLTSKLPFSARGITELMKKHLYSEPEKPTTHNPEVPENLEKIALKLLAKSPSDRYNSAADVLRALEHSADAVAPVPSLAAARIWIPRIVGRAEPLARIREAIGLLTRGQGGLLVVEGSDGVGKTRLVETGLSIAHSQGITAYTGRCLEGGQTWGEGFQGVIESVAVELDQTGLPPEALARSRRHFGGKDRPAPATRPEDPGDQFIEDLAALFLHLTLISPRIIWIDDLHRADPGTLNGLQALSRQLIRIGAPLLVVVTLRPQATPPTLPHQWLSNAESSGIRVRRIMLSPLEPNDATNLLETLLPRDPRAPLLARRLHREASGNSLLLVEYVRLLIAQGRIVPRTVDGETRWVLSMDPDEIQHNLVLPKGVKLTLESRLAAYTQQNRVLLRLFALWGRTLRFQALLSLASATEDVVTRYVDRLLADGWLSEQWIGGEEGYVLAHPAYRAVLLAELSPSEQLKLRSFIDLRLGSRTAG